MVAENSMKTIFLIVYNLQNNNGNEQVLVWHRKEDFPRIKHLAFSNRQLAENEIEKAFSPLYKKILKIIEVEIKEE